MSRHVGWPQIWGDMIRSCRSNTCIRQVTVEMKIGSTDPSSFNLRILCREKERVGETVTCLYLNHDEARWLHDCLPFSDPVSGMFAQDRSPENGGDGTVQYVSVTRGPLAARYENVPTLLFESGHWSGDRHFTLLDSEQVEIKRLIRAALDEYDFYRYEDDVADVCDHLSSICLNKQ